MALERAYGRVYWQNEMPIFHIVSPVAREFFLYPEPLLALWEKINSDYVQVKRRTFKAHKRQGEYLGDIVGYLEDYNDGSEDYMVLTLYFGESSRDIGFKTVKEIVLPTNCIEERQYCFPKDEFVSFVNCIKVMYYQQALFVMNRAGAVNLQYSAAIQEDTKKKTTLF